MAFSTSNVHSMSLGNIKATYGDWSGSESDASGSVTVSGGRVYLASFISQDTSQRLPVTAAVSTSGTTGTVTITVYNLSGVTSGRFFIIHA